MQNADASVAIIRPLVPKTLDATLTPDLKATFVIAAKAARAYESTVMLLGETGVGKTQFARYIHDTSPRAGKPFNIIDLSQATPSLFESELFGHEKGAYTGANQAIKSPFEEADGGTVFLDEVGTLSFELQARLLRLVQDKTFKRVGGTKDIQVDVRIVAATSMNLKEMVDKGEFREDLFHRLNVVEIYVPPLRDRPNDIIPLAEYFLQQAAKKDRLPVKELSDDAKSSLLAHHWKGNVRALENEMRRLTIMTDGDVIEPSDLSFNQNANNVFALPVRSSTTQADDQDKMVSAFVETLSQFKTFQDIKDVCDEAKRHIFSTIVSRNGFATTRSARDMHVHGATLSSRFRGLFQAKNVDGDTVRHFLKEWQTNKENHPHAVIAGSIAQTALDIDLPVDKMEMVDQILLATKKEMVKKIMPHFDFNHRLSASSLGASPSALNDLLTKELDLKGWYKEAIRSFKGLPAPSSPEL